MKRKQLLAVNIIGIILVIFIIVAGKIRYYKMQVHNLNEFEAIRNDLDKSR